MTIKPRTYYEAFCDAPAHRDDERPVEFGEFTAFRDADRVAESISDSDGLVAADGRVFCCWECIPADVCPDAANNVHVYDDGVCTKCGRDAAFEPVTGEKPAP